MVRNSSMKWIALAEPLMSMLSPSKDSPYKARKDLSTSGEASQRSLRRLRTSVMIKLSVIF
jgi:hypothetical protein